MAQRKSQASTLIVWFLAALVLSAVALTFFLAKGPEHQTKSFSVNLNRYAPSEQSQVASKLGSAEGRVYPHNASTDGSDQTKGGDFDLSQKSYIDPTDGQVPSHIRRTMVSRSTNKAEKQLPEPSAALEKIAGLVDSGKWVEAEQMLTELLSFDPENEKALIEMALIQLIERQDPYTARSYLENAVRLNPNNEHLVMELLAVYSETGQLESGLSFLKSIPSQDRHTSGVDLAIASALYKAGKADQAVPYFLTAAENAGPSDSKAQEGLIDAYIELGRYEEALDLGQALAEHESRPNRVRAIKLQIVTAYVEKGAYEEAAEILQELREQNPSDPLISQLISDVSRRVI